jgi:epoxyqueuosine reductase
VDPTKLFPGAKSIVSVALNYFPKEKQLEGSPKLSKYAYGKDYHFVIKNKLKSLLQHIEEELGTTINGRAFVDSAPVMDKVWAAKAGLGWQGKNVNLINPKLGSFFFLGEIILDVELQYDQPIKDYCGTCTACIDACPTNALYEPYKIDGNRCISYYTIELKEELPKGLKNQFEDWMFGCDICQDVCPWNRFSTPTLEEWFKPHPELLQMDRKAWTELTKDVFQEIFRKSAVKRTRFEGLKRNINYLQQD